MIKSESVFAFSRQRDGATDSANTARSVVAPTRRTLMNMMVSTAALTAASTKFSFAAAVSEKSPSDTAELWAKRQVLVERSNQLHSDWREAFGKLPAWAAPGPRLLAHDGTYCDAVVGWPLNPDVVPSERPGAYRVCRISPREIREHFDFSVKTFALSAQARAEARARMRTSMRKLIARLRAKREEWARLGLDSLADARDAASNDRFDIEEIILEGEQTADQKAASILISLQEDCFQADTADDNSTMRMACIALELLQPHLTGLIAEHTAYFLDNREVALRDMPFAVA